jgi:hypothetical protein
MNPEIIHHYSPRHVFTLWSIPAMLNSENHIIPWEYNRPVDRLRVEEIVEYIARKNILDWTIYMIYDSKTDQPIAGMEMQDLEALGVIKFDILGIALLDKVMTISDLLKNGE